MIKIVGDTHTHTIACDHAYSTLSENVARAKELGHRFICVTEHAPALPGCASKVYFSTMPSILPTKIDGVELIKGVELNILDYEGNVDLPVEIITQLEWVIASYHPPCIKHGSKADHTRGWIKIAENPHVDVIGHCGREWFEFEHLTALKAFKEAGKIVEINSHSMRSDIAAENCYKIAQLCAQLSIPVVLSSDAHIHSDVGMITPAAKMFEEIGFPQELILNATHERFVAALANIGVTDIM